MKTGVCEFVLGAEKYIRQHHPRWRMCFSAGEHKRKSTKIIIKSILCTQKRQNEIPIR